MKWNAGLRTDGVALSHSSCSPGSDSGCSSTGLSTAGGRDLDPHAAKYSTSRTARSGGFSPERETATGQGVVTDTSVARKGASPLHCHVTFFVEHPSKSFVFSVLTPAASKLPHVLEHISFRKATCHVELFY